MVHRSAKLALKFPRSANATKGWEPPIYVADNELIMSYSFRIIYNSLIYNILPYTPWSTDCMIPVIYLTSRGVLKSLRGEHRYRRCEYVNAKIRFPANQTPCGVTYKTGQCRNGLILWYPDVSRCIITDTHIFHDISSSKYIVYSSTLTARLELSQSIPESLSPTMFNMMDAGACLLKLWLRLW